MIYSSYYGNVKKLIEFGVPKKSFVNISISVPAVFEVLPSEPDVFQWDHLVWGYKKGVVSWKKYAIEYYNKLNSLDKWDELYWIDFCKKYNGKILLCFEKDVKKCHRYLLGKFLDWKFGKCRMIEIDGQLNCWKIRNQKGLVYCDNIGEHFKIIDIDGNLQDLPGVKNNKNTGNSKNLQIVHKHNK